MPLHHPLSVPVAPERLPDRVCVGDFRIAVGKSSRMVARRAARRRPSPVETWLRIRGTFEAETYL